MGHLSGTFGLRRSSEAHGRKESPLERRTQWSCKHCTYLNPIGSKVCEMCYKTSWESDDTSEPEIKVGLPEDVCKLVYISRAAEKREGAHCPFYLEHI